MNAMPMPDTSGMFEPLPIGEALIEENARKLKLAKKWRGKLFILPMRTPGGPVTYEVVGRTKRSKIPFHTFIKKADAVDFAQTASFGKTLR